MATRLGIYFRINTPIENRLEIEIIKLIVSENHVFIQWQIRLWRKSRFKTKKSLELVEGFLIFNQIKLDHFENRFGIVEIMINQGSDYPSSFDSSSLPTKVTDETLSPVSLKRMRRTPWVSRPKSGTLE